MKVRTLVMTLALAVLLPTAARADEGMWLLSLIGKNYSDMQKAGFKLSPEDIYNVNQSCLKDAIVGLGNEGTPFWHFCTGEISTPETLCTSPIRPPRAAVVSAMISATEATMMPTRTPYFLI